ncbi:MAG: pre-16S rRNA-processing nuclease YqgF [Microcystaceae cyanobacterium]
MTFWLGFDPGRDKCGVAVMEGDRSSVATTVVHFHQVFSSAQVLEAIPQLCQDFGVERVIMGNQTTSKQWKAQLESVLSSSVTVTLVDERNSSVEARDRYWQMYPAKGLTKLIPQGLRTPPRPVDDIVAIILIERYLLTYGLVEKVTT